MITINRTSSQSVQEQLAEQLRYQIVSGRYTVGDTLPSTRTLATQLGISFHTVRKAYQSLEQEGLLEARKGSGFSVVNTAPLNKADRMERGAAVVEEALHRMIGLGLQEAEVEYLFQEQLTLLEQAQDQPKVLFVAPYQELAAWSATQVAMALQRPVEGVTQAQLSRHKDADYIFAAPNLVAGILASIPGAEVTAVVSTYEPQVLDRIARLLRQDTLGVVTRYADAIPVLLPELRHLTGFSGQMIAISTEEGVQDWDELVAQTDLLVYTAANKRRVSALRDVSPAPLVLAPTLTAASLELVRQTVPA